jgi:hypothetical protein
LTKFDNNLADTIVFADYYIAVLPYFTGEKLSTTIDSIEIKIKFEQFRLFKGKLWA